MLSIIIPTLNEEKYLPVLLSQIKKQNFSGDLEVIVADAGSKDKTIEIAKSYGCKVVKGGLPAKGRNEGAKVAQGEIFLFMDADNIFLPENFLNKLLAEFKRRKLGVVSFPIYPVDEKIDPTRNNSVDFTPCFASSSNGIDKILYGIYNNFVNLTQIPYATNSVLVKKEIFEKVAGGFDEEIKIGEDHYFAKQVAKFAKFGFVKIEPVLTSERRFIKDGRPKTYLKYLLAGIYMFFFGPIKKDIFKYKFTSLENSNGQFKQLNYHTKKDNYFPKDQKSLLLRKKKNKKTKKLKSWKKLIKQQIKNKRP